MRYPWPLSDADRRLDEALRIAMQYLELKGLADDYYALQKYVALQIVNEWHRGIRHPLRLANAAIATTEALLKPHAEEV
jgi:hypothetical protein